MSKQDELNRLKKLVYAELYNATNPGSSQFDREVAAQAAIALALLAAVEAIAQVVTEK